MGMELQERKLNYRQSFPVNITQPIAGNYYPVQSGIVMTDPNTKERLFIMPDRAQGGTSPYHGSLELMIHRRLLRDDGKGVTQNLNEVDWDGQGMRQWVTHNILLSKADYLAPSYRQVQMDRDVDILTFFSDLSSVGTPNQTPEPAQSVGFIDIDPMVKLTTRPINATQFLLRFHNMDDASNRTVHNSVFKSPAYASLHVVETSLSANQPKTEMLKRKLNWNGLDLNNPNYAKTDYYTGTEFVLRPQEIRTFVVTVNN